MALWYTLKIGGERIGTAVVQRREKLDLSDPEAIKDEVCTYDVYVDLELVGQVSHRYGDGGWALAATASSLIAKNLSR